MTPAEEKLAAILADKKATVPQKVANYIKNWPVNQLNTLNPEKLAEIFKIPLKTLSIQFEKKINKSLDEYILYYKMFMATSLMREQKNKPWSSSEISQMLGYENYQDFVKDFQSQFLTSPQKFRELLTKRYMTK